MHDTQPGSGSSPRASAASRRALVRWTAGAAGAAALTAIPGTRWTHIAAAQEDVILTAAAAEIGASPGAAFARSAAAEAAAARGAARVQAAAALAEADSDDGAITQSPVAHAVAVPGEGAEAQSAIAVASASSQDDTDDARVAAPAKIIAPAARGGRGDRRAAGGGGGRRARGSGRAMRVGRGGGRRGRGGRRDQVGSLPSSGIGSMEPGPLASLFAVASAAAALGSVVLRREAEAAVAVLPAVVED
jgi:hypothetical protein